MSAVPEQWSDCFWSYVRRDNEDLRGRIDHIREDLIRQYSLETGEDLRIFVDGEDIGWGEDWQETLDIGVGRTAFFIPLVTPRYIKSSACRDELLKFHAICEARGISELILPIVIARPEGLSKEDPDEVVRIIASANYEPFNEVIRSDRDSQRWMEAILRLVVKLQQAERRVEDNLSRVVEREINVADEVAVAETRGGSQVGWRDDDSRPGIFDLAEQLEPAFGKATESLTLAMRDFENLSGLVEKHGALVKEASADQGRYKLGIINMAEAIKVPTQALTETASAAQRDIVEVDKLIREIWNIFELDRESEIMRGPRAAFQDAIGNVGDLSGVVRDLDMLAGQMATAENISYILRKALRPARGAVLMLRDSANRANSWSRYRDESAG
ncbi:toll/interleukin-1 receptor domain-containing protein [Amycolatopsis azurea]|uniref:toll/interleukin-1 receptor domain-containing protein n=1 Tax=Amycolatopsis azurea TaxID=36819 RepID=UPI00381968AA